MVDLSSLPQMKQLIQLRISLTSDMRRVLEHKLDVAPDSIVEVDTVLEKLQTHVKSINNEALRRKAFSKCQQMEGETFDDFWIRLKLLSQEVDLCKIRNQTCIDEWTKHGILMGIRDEKLTQKLVEMDASATLRDVLEKCRSHESTKSASSALRDTAKTCAVSQYKKDKKAAHKEKSGNKPSTSAPPASSDKCNCCG